VFIFVADTALNKFCDYAERHIKCFVIKK